MKDRALIVMNTLAGDLALELGKGKQDVQGQPPHRARSVELLGDRDDINETVTAKFPNQENR
jgi:hypothetical protein